MSREIRRELEERGDGRHDHKLLARQEQHDRIVEGVSSGNQNLTYVR
jgi:hypothetical protein